jgi:selenocysteine-specific elongation factor
MSYRLDVVLDELVEIPDGTRLHVHHGTGEHYGRVVRAGSRYAQLRLSEPVVAERGDHVVLRDRTTVGGGTVLDPQPPRHAAASRFDLLERGDLGALVHAPVRAQSLRGLVEGDGLLRAGEWVFSQSWLEEERAALHARRATADPLDPGVPPPAEPWGADVLPLLGVERRGSLIYLPDAAPSLGARAAEAAELETRLVESGFEALKIEDKDLAAYLEREGRLVRVGDGLAVGSSAYDDAKRRLLEECETAGSITLARFRDLLGTGRKQAQLFLERFDADGLTRRVGDERVLRRKAKSA